MLAGPPALSSGGPDHRHRCRSNVCHKKASSELPEEDALPPYRSPAVAEDGIGTVSV